MSPTTRGCASTPSTTRGLERRCCGGRVRLRDTRVQLRHAAPLKNAIDYLHTEWHYKPVGLVSYGGVSAGTRAAQMPKQVLTTLKMFPLAEAVRSPSSPSSSTRRASSQPNEVMEKAADAMLDELARVAGALAPLRA